MVFTTTSHTTHINIQGRGVSNTTRTYGSGIDIMLRHDV